MKKHNNNFDFFRIVASGMVVVTHSFALKGMPDNSDWLGAITNGHFSLSYIGVQIFFYISGYLIYSSFKRSPSVANYLYKRCLRIFPGLFVLLLICVLVFGPLLTTLRLPEYFDQSNIWLFLRSLSLFRLHGSLAGVFANNPLNYEMVGSLWTLAYEFTCYLLLLILVFIRIDYLKYLLSLYVVGCTILLFQPILFSKLPQNIPFIDLKLIHFINFTSSFGIGVLFNVYEKYLLTSKKALIALSIMGVFFLVSQYYPLIYIAVKVIFPILLFSTAKMESVVNQAGKWGDPSYGVYIYSFPIQQSLVFVTDNSISLFWMITISLILSYGAGYLSWHFVEKLALSFKPVNTH